jgi:hypothetical protein
MEPNKEKNLIEGLYTFFGTKTTANPRLYLLAILLPYKMT